MSSTIDSVAKSSIHSAPLPVLYTTHFQETVPYEVLQDCVTLHKNHYGVWSKLPANASILAAMNLKPGDPVTLRTVARMKKEHFYNRDCRVVTARMGNQHIGHVIYTTFATVPRDDHRLVRWISQLVVHGDYRRQGIASTLVGHATADKRALYAVGLVSCHPGAVRSVEWSTGRRCCDAKLLAEVAPQILDACTVPYMKEKTLVNDQCIVDMQFFVDHAEVQQVVNDFQEEEKWSLGKLPEGHEFCAISLVKRLTPSS